MFDTCKKRIKEKVKMQKAQEIIKKYVEGDRFENLLNELKENNINFANEENLDIRYGKLKTDMEEKSRLYAEAQKHIENLSQGVKSSEDLKAKQNEYERKIKALEAENQEIKVSSSLKQALIKEKATDIEYLTYKIKNEYQNSKTPFEFSADGSLKGLDEMIDRVKKQHINLFEPQTVTKDVEVLNVGKGDNNTETEPKNLMEALKAKYNQK